MKGKKMKRFLVGLGLVVVASASIGMYLTQSSVDQPSQVDKPLTDSGDVKNPVTGQRPVLAGDAFDSSMVPVLTSALSEIDAAKAQFSKAWDYTLFTDNEKAALFKQKDRNFGADYPNINLTDVRVSVIGERCLRDGYPLDLSQSERASFNKQIVWRTQAASLIFDEQDYPIDMQSEASRQSVYDMRVWYRYVYSRATNKNGLCAQVSQAIKDSQQAESDISKHLRDPQKVGVDLAGYFLEFEAAAGNNPLFCSDFMAKEGVVDNTTEVKAMVLSDMKDASTDVDRRVDTSSYFAFKKNNAHDILGGVFEMMEDSLSRVCLQHVSTLESLSIDESFIDDKGLSRQNQESSEQVAPKDS